MKRSFLLACLCGGALLLALLAGNTARADSTRITQGDAQAVFEAFGNGGFAVLKHSQVVEAAPADQTGSQGAIRPFKPWDGLHLCALDWHVILVADIEAGPQQDAEAIMAGITFTFQLDG